MDAIPATTGRRPLRAVPLRALPDERLARLAARGDRDAFGAIFHRHHQGIFRYCRSLVGSQDDAADALQNTMAAALKAIDGETRDINVKPWLYRIAHNESISLLRRRRPQTDLDAELAETLPDQSGSPAAREVLQQLVTDLRELPGRQRGALVMRELSGFGYEEIAAAFGISGAAAKQTVYEARCALHELAEGREMACDSIRELISENDGRRLGSRRVRAHLRDCLACRAFKASIDDRSRHLAMLAPPLVPLAAADILKGLFGGDGGTGSGGLLSFLGGASGKAGVLAAGTTKGLAAAAVAVGTAAGGVAVSVDGSPFGSSPPGDVAPATATRGATPAATPGQPAVPAGGRDRAESLRERAERRDIRRKDGRRGADKTSRGRDQASSAAGRPGRAGANGRNAPSHARPAPGRPGSRGGAQTPGVAPPRPQGGAPGAPGTRPPGGGGRGSAPAPPAAAPPTPAPVPAAPAPAPTVPATPPQAGASQPQIGSQAPVAPAPVEPADGADAPGRR